MSMKRAYKYLDGHELNRYYSPSSMLCIEVPMKLEQRTLSSIPTIKLYIPTHIDVSTLGFCLRLLCLRLSSAQYF